MMKITAGLGSPESYPRLVSAGADELFAGFVPLDWLEKYGNITPLNRREVLMHNIQLDSMGEMQLLASMVADHGAPVAVTFNSISYLPAQFPMIGDMIASLAGLGFRDWILADPALILYLRSQNTPGRIHLSGDAGCFNPDALRLFCRLGVDRLIFPRKIRPEEMSACIRAVPGLEYEAFALNELCHYSGALCASLHCDELDHICHLPYLPFGPDCKPAAEHDFPEDGFGAGGCALCALPRLARAGVTHLKIVGRGAHIKCMERDIRMMRRALEMTDASPEELRRAILGQNCSKRCYYPL